MPSVSTRRFSQLPKPESSGDQLRRGIPAIHGGSCGGGGGHTGKSKRYRGGATALRRNHDVQLAAAQRCIPRRPRCRPGYWRPWSLGHSICAKVRLSGSLDTAADEIAARVHEFIDMPKESTPGEEIMASNDARPPFPPFTRESAMQKVRLAEDGWNTRDPGRVALAYAIDSRWRNRSEFVNGRNEIIAFLSRKWARELDYRLIKELWAFTENRIAVRFAYEWHDDSLNWFRSYGNENWDFAANGLMQRRLASINDLPIKVSERKFHWDRS